MGQFSGKAAIVTGSTSGIGFAIARALAGEGAAIMLNGLGEPAEIKNLQGELARRYNVPVEHDAADMTRPAEFRAMVGRAETVFGRVDILANNAGIQHTAPIEAFPEERWDAILAINLSAAFHATKAVLPGMRARGTGRIVNTASVQGLIGSPEKCAYVSAKHGIIGLTKVTALETAETGITCNAICPGAAYTALLERQLEARAAKLGITKEEAGREWLKAGQPTRRFVKTEEIGALVVFLCSEAAASITGTALPIDGGKTAH